MVHMLGSKLLSGKAPHQPKLTVVMNISRATEDGAAITIKTGTISVSDDRYRAWYQPLFKSGEEHHVAMSSPPLSLDKARALALKQAELLAFQVDLGLRQLLDEAEAEAKERAKIDSAIKSKG
jgi:hypothetical protein